MIQPATTSFLNNLRKNNNRNWFEEHRKEYETARADFLQFTQKVIDQFGKKDRAVAELKAKDCMFRINRDVRFSKNKDPYKTNFAASFSKGGKKSGFAGYYIHLEPDRLMMGGGIWMPEPDQIKKIRQEIDYNWSDFEKTIRNKSFQKVYGDLYMGSDVKLTRPPKGYEADHPAVEYLKLKSWIVTANLNNQLITSNTLQKEIHDAFVILQPLIRFINQALEDSES
jgi:uncharacterized protein (TIGR02453 family)